MLLEIGAIMKNKIIVVTHGNLGEAFLDTASLIVGVLNHVVTFGVDLGCDIDGLKKKIEAEIVDAQANDKEVVILTDLFYGTPFNITVSLMETYNFVHITGINLGFFLEIITKENSIYEDQLDSYIKHGREGLVNTNEFLLERT